MVCKITLTRGFEALVDPADYERFLGNGKWTAHPGYKGKVYAKRYGRKNGKQCVVFLHRLITDAPDGMVVDHINGNTLDNRRSNLRLCTHQQNSWNRKSTVANTGFFGVHKNFRKNSWRGIVCLNGKLHYTRSCKSPEQAARLRDELAIRLCGEFATLNFPTERIA